MLKHFYSKYYHEIIMSFHSVLVDPIFFNFSLYLHFCYSLLLIYLLFINIFIYSFIIYLLFIYYLFVPSFIHSFIYIYIYKLAFSLSLHPQVAQQIELGAFIGRRFRCALTSRIQNGRLAQTAQHIFKRRWFKRRCRAPKQISKWWKFYGNVQEENGGREEEKNDGRNKKIWR